MSPRPPSRALRAAWWAAATLLIAAAASQAPSAVLAQTACDAAARHALPHEAASFASIVPAVGGSAL